MPIFDIQATANLYTELEPLGSLQSTEIVDLEDATYYSYRELNYELEFTFTLEADDEDAAHEEAERLLRTLRYHGDSMEWEIIDPDVVDITMREEPMTLERATQILSEWIEIGNHAVARERPIAVTLTPELIRAINFILAYHRDRPVAAINAVTTRPGIVATAPLRT